MTYLALHDNQNGRYMATGLNVNTPSELKAALIGYYSGDHDDEELAGMDKMDVFELADYGDFTIVSGNVPFDENEDWMF